ncbi:MAG: HNH endonuclease [Acidimicrobiia bacterium]|nr:HNH endonuclease [Acidimicrobiia bacterium]
MRRPARSRRPDTKVIVLISYEALKRGLAEANETCEIAGTGPVPVSTVRALMGDAFGAVIVTNGVDVFTVAHLGRSVTAHQRSALEARGYRCEVPGCGSTTALEIDHIEDWHKSFRTKLDQLAWHCGPHHKDKTYRGWRLEGPPGDRRWVPPEAVPRRDAPGPEPPPAEDLGRPTLFGDPSAA